jgi:hypothetical protein
VSEETLRLCKSRCRGGIEYVDVPILAKEKPIYWEKFVIRVCTLTIGAISHIYDLSGGADARDDDATRRASILSTPAAVRRVNSELTMRCYMPPCRLHQIGHCKKYPAGLLAAGMSLSIC